MHSEGVSAAAIDLLNRVRARSVEESEAYTLGDFPTAGALLGAIHEERRKELAFEGFHRYDRIRNGLPPRDNGLPAGKWVLPIPQREIDISDGLIVQNPGYVD